VKNRTIQQGRVSRHQVSSPEPSDEAIREDIRALIAGGYLRWTDPTRTIDDIPSDEPLPVELTDKPLPPPSAETLRDVEAEFLAFFGVSDLAGIEGAEDRKVMLSEGSNIVCPAHGRELVPDACRSCSFLAGEVEREHR
jgi:hypothetical protein